MSESSQQWRHRNNVEIEIRHVYPFAVAGLEKIYRSKKHVDCKFLVGPDKVPIEAHKLVLAMVSEVFEKQLYSDNTSDEPILVPDVDPDIFEEILRYIYLNDQPKTIHFTLYVSDLENIDQYKLIKLWYVTSKYQLGYMNRDYFGEIQVNITNWFVAYEASKMLLNGPYAVAELTKFRPGRQKLQDERKDAERLISRCHKLFSVKTPEALSDSRFIKHMPERFLQELFALKYMSIDSELALFEALVKYANENGWKPNDKYFLEKDENGTELATPFQKYIRVVMKQIRFLSMTLKAFDSVPSKSGFFTEFEVETIRNRIAEESSQCVSIAGFSTLTDKKRHEVLKVTFSDTQQQHNKEDKDIEKLEFNVEFPQDTLGVSESFTLNNLTWRIIIYKCTEKDYFHNQRFDYTVYLKCDGSTETERWKCFAQLDLVFETNLKRKVFENIPWQCFKGSPTRTSLSDSHTAPSNYSQSCHINFESPVKTFHMELAVSPHEVSYNNENSHVSATYGRHVRNYE